MRILMLTPDYPPHSFGGIAGYVRNLSENLVILGVEVHVIVMRCDYFISDSYEEEVDRGIHVYRFEDKKREPGDSNFINRWTENSLTILENVNKIIFKNEFNLIHMNDVFTALLVDDIRDKLKIPIVNTIHGISAPIQLLEDGARRYGYFSAHGVIAVSHNMKNNLEKRYGRINDLRVIHLGIDSIRHSEIKKKMITFAGRLIDDKGADVLIKAISILKKSQKLSGYKTMIMGEGCEKDSLESLAKRMDLENDIIFSGLLPHEEVRKRISEAAIHVVPSKFEEPFGVSASEGLANGAFTIVSNRGGLVEYIHHEQNGLVFESDNPEDLAEKIEQAMSNQELYELCVKNAYTYAEQHTWRHVAEETLDYYRKIETVKYTSDRIR